MEYLNIIKVQKEYLTLEHVRGFLAIGFILPKSAKNDSMLLNAYRKGSVGHITNKRWND